MRRRLVGLYLFLAIAVIGVCVIAQTAYYTRLGVEHGRYGAQNTWSYTVGGVTYSLHGQSPVNVLAFGVEADGTTDDTDSLQACNDSIVAWGGDVMYFPPGDYRMSSIFNASANMAYIGAKGATLIQDTLVGFFELSEADTNILIQGFKFRGTMDNTAYESGMNGRSCISFGRHVAVTNVAPKNVTIRDCEFDHPFYCGVTVGNNASNIIIEDCRFRVGEHAVYVASANNVLITGCVVDSAYHDNGGASGQTGFKIVGARDCTITDNWVVGGVTHGIICLGDSVSYGTGHHKILNNHVIRAKQIGIYAAGGIIDWDNGSSENMVEIRGNTIRDADQYGMWLKRMRGGVVADNKIWNSKQGGVICRYVSKVKFLDNEFLYTNRARQDSSVYSYSEIEMYDECDSLFFDGNHFQGAYEDSASCRVLYAGTNDTTKYITFTPNNMITGGYYQLVDGPAAQVKTWDFGGPMDVTMWGAKGDSSTDDAADIEKCLEYASGKVVRFPGKLAGHTTGRYYKLGSAVDITQDNVTLLIEEGAVLFVPAAHTTQGAIAANAVSGLTITGSGTITGPGKGVAASGANGIGLTDAAGTVIQGIAINGFYRGIYADNATTGNSYRNLAITDCAYTGLVGNTGDLIAGCSFEGVGSDTTNHQCVNWPNGVSEGARAVGNYFADSPAAVGHRVYNCADGYNYMNMVFGQEAFYGCWGGYYVVADTVLGLNISGSSIEGSTGNGMTLSGCIEGSHVQAVIRDSDGMGAYIGENSSCYEGIAPQFNTFDLSVHGAGAAGVTFLGHYNDLKLAVTNATADGLRIAGKYNQVRLTAYDNGLSGLQFWYASEDTFPGFKNFVWLNSARNLRGLSIPANSDSNIVDGVVWGNTTPIWNAAAVFDSTNVRQW